MAKHNVPDVHYYEVDLIDADGKPATKRLQGVREGRDNEAMLDFLRRNPTTLNDGKGRAPRRFVGIRRLEAADADQAAASRPPLPPGLEKNVKAAETGDAPDAND